jgi:hypothetical protein
MAGFAPHESTTPSPLVMRALAVVEKGLGIDEVCNRLGVAEAAVRAAPSRCPTNILAAHRYRYGH